MGHHLRREHIPNQSFFQQFSCVHPKAGHFNHVLSAPYITFAELIAVSHCRAVLLVGVGLPLLSHDDSKAVNFSYYSFTHSI